MVLAAFYMHFSDPKWRDLLEIIYVESLSNSGKIPTIIQ
jgi:hypothetical protein